MPMFTVERQYLVPVYEHITLEAETAEAACRAAVDEDLHPLGDNPKTDYESSRETCVSGIWAGDAAHDGGCLAIPEDLAVTV